MIYLPSLSAEISALRVWHYDLPPFGGRFDLMVYLFSYISYFLPYFSLFVVSFSGLFSVISFAFLLPFSFRVFLLSCLFSFLCLLFVAQKLDSFNMTFWYLKNESTEGDKEKEKRGKRKKKKKKKQKEEKLRRLIWKRFVSFGYLYSVSVCLFFCQTPSKKGQEHWKDKAFNSFFICSFLLVGWASCSPENTNNPPQAKQKSQQPKPSKPKQNRKVIKKT